MNLFFLIDCFLNYFFWSNLYLWLRVSILSNWHPRGTKSIPYLSFQLLVTLSRILNLWSKYGTHLLSEHVDHFMIAFVHLMSHNRDEIGGENQDRLGQKSHPCGTTKLVP